MFSWFKKKYDPEKLKELEKKENNLVTGSSKVQLATQILSQIDDLSPEITVDEFIYTVSGQQRKTGKKIKKRIAPKVKFVSEEFFAIEFDQKVNSNRVQDYVQNIGLLFHGHGIINSSRVIMTRTPNPFVFNFKILPELKSGIKNIQLQTDKYIDFLSNLDKKNIPVFLGASQNPSDILESEIIIESLKSSPHFLIAGQTRSGKTKTMLSLSYSFSILYPESIGSFWFADGKNSPDYTDFASKLSNHPVAFKFGGEDPLIELANMIKSVWAEYERRQVIFKEFQNLGYSPSTYLEMTQIALKEGLDSRFILPRCFIIVDEFASFVTDAPENLQTLIQTEGSIFYFLGRLLRESASFGFSFILGSQRVQATDFPPVIKSNLTTRMIHSVQQSDAKYLELDGIAETLNTGEFILNYPGLKCSISGNTNIKSRLPYIGDYFVLDLPVLHHQKYDYDLIYTKNSKQLDVSKLTKEELQKYIKSTILVREGLAVKKENNPKFDFLTLNFDCNSSIWNIGLADANDFVSDDFTKRVHQISDPELLNYPTIWFILGSITNNKKIMDIGSNVGKDDIVFLPQDWTRIINKSYSMYSNNNSEPFFTLLLNSKINQKEQDQKEIETKFNHSDVVISVAEYERISNLGAKTDSQKERKGLEFEQFVGALLSLNYHVYSSDELFAKSWYKRNEGGKGDNGLDLLLILKTDSNAPKPDLTKLSLEQSESRIVCQLKNWNQSLDAKVLGELLRAQNNFKCLVTDEPIKQAWIVTSSTLTGPAQKEAQNNNIEVIDNNKIKKLIKEYIKEPSNDEVKDERSSVFSLSNEGLSQRKIAQKLEISLGKVNKILKEHR